MITGVVPPIEIVSSDSEITEVPRPKKVGTFPPSKVSTILARTTLFQGLTECERNVVLADARRRTYRRDSILAEQGRPADKLFMLVAGSARYFFTTSSGLKVNLFWLVPGDIFGGASLLTEPAHFIVSTETVQDSKVLVWQRDRIRALATKFPRVLENSLSIACDYLVWYLATHLSLVSHSARQRLAHVLLSLAQGIGRTSSNGIYLEITNEQLANTANLTPFTVSRLLSQWQRNGSISKRRGQIVLSRPERLFDKDATQRRLGKAI